ncbi:unnamed protein product, partial [Didymodactylos carnosus]
MQGVAQSYDNSDHWSIRRQILSIVTKNIPLDIAQKFIPNLTPWRFKQARSHADFEGKGVTVDTTRSPRVGYEKQAVSHFIQFIVSPN